MTRHEGAHRFVLLALVLAGTSTACRCLVEDEEESRERRAEDEGRREARGDAEHRGRRVRPAALAGSWYSGDAEDLRRSVEGFLDAAEPPTVRDPIAFVLPHAGHRWSGPTAAFGYRLVRGKSFRRVFVLGPSHRYPLEGAAVPAADAFETPLGTVPVDTRVTSALAAAPEIAMDDRPHAREHSIEIHLPFLQVALKEGFRIVPVLVGDVDPPAARRIADALRPHVARGDLVIASSDFTHYGRGFDFVPFTEDVPSRIDELDMGAFERIRARSPEDLAAYRERTGITVCGLRPIMVLLALLPEGTEVKRLHYDTSGRQTDDYGNSVSYLSIAMYGARWPEIEAPAAPGLARVRPEGGPAILDEAEQRKAITLARGVLEQFVRSGRTPEPEDFGVTPRGAFRRELGVFVTLEIEDRLHGCIGFTQPVMPLGDAIVSRTMAAAARDSRFRPVRAEELDRISIEISVLTPPREVDGWQQIEIGKHGIIIEKDGLGAVYLPHVPVEQNWTIEETLTHLSEKAGLPPNAWREGMQFAVFEAQLFEEVRD